MLLNILECIGTLGILLTLAFVAEQTRATAKAAIGSPWDRIASQMFAMDNVFIDHPEMRPYFFEGMTIAPDNPDYHLAVSIAEFRLDFLDQTLQQKRLFPDDWDDSAWRCHIVWSLQQSPVMAAHLASLPWSYSMALKDCLRQARATPDPTIAERTAG